MSNKGRIEYIDAMRELTMILVVYSHICLFCLGDMLLGVNDIFIVIITIALIVMLISLIASYILRLSPFLAKYLFGIERKV